MPDRRRALVLVLGWGGLRIGEALGLQRGDVDTERGILTVCRSLIELDDGSTHLDTPKTEAGRRTVTLPAVAMEALSEHLSRFCGPGPESPVFGTRAGTPDRRSNVRRSLRPALESLGLQGVRLHDLRHTGATIAAQSGATTKELMRRLGHASPAASLVYQHAADERDEALARAMDEAAASNVVPLRRKSG